MFWKETGKHLDAQRDGTWCVVLADSSSAHSNVFTSTIRTH